MEYSVFVFLSPFVVFALIFFLALSRKNRDHSPTKYLSYVLVCALGFLFFNNLELLAVSDFWIVFWARWEHVFISLMPPLWLLFVFDYTRKGKWKQPGRFWPFFVPGLFHVLLVFTNDFHHLIWRETVFVQIETFRVARNTQGLLHYADMIINHTMLFFGVAVLYKEFSRNHRIFRRQIFWLTVGVAILITLNVVYFFKVFPWLRKDFTPIGFALAGITTAIGVFRHRFLELTPIPRTAVFDALSEGILVVDGRGLAADFNTAAAKIFGLTEHDLGRGLSPGSLHASLVAEAALSEEAVFWKNVDRPEGGETRNVEVRISRIIDPRGRRRGCVVVVSDITERRKLYEEVKTLRGIVPICVNCKNVRTDEGYWQQVEAYVADRSYAEFSHGLCPACMDKLYPLSASGVPLRRPKTE